MARGILHRVELITHDDLKKFFFKDGLSILRQPWHKRGDKMEKPESVGRTRVPGVERGWTGKLSIYFRLELAFAAPSSSSAAASESLERPIGALILRACRARSLCGSAEAMLNASRAALRYRSPHVLLPSDCLPERSCACLAS